MSLLAPISESDKRSLSVLLAAYLRELRELVDGDWNPEAYPFLDVQWTEPGRHPFFIQSAGERVGFAIVRDPLSTGTGLNQMTDFYLQPAYRGTGLAESAAHAVFRRFPGRWELQVHELNERARRFWLKCIEDVSEASPRAQQLDFNGELKQHYLFEVD